MQNPFGMFAVVTDLNPIPSFENSSPRFFPGDIFTTLGVLLVVAALLILLVILVRRKKIRNHGNLSRSAWPAGASNNLNPPAGSLRPRDGHRRHHRRRRREHRPRNPTLADTGGLPPKRPNDQPPPSV